MCTSFVKVREKSFTKLAKIFPPAVQKSLGETLTRSRRGGQVGKRAVEVVVLVLRQAQPLLLDVHELLLGAEVRLSRGQILPEHVLLQVIPLVQGGRRILLYASCLREINDACIIAAAKSRFDGNFLLLLNVEKRLADLTTIPDSGA